MPRAFAGCLLSVAVLMGDVAIAAQTDVDGFAGLASVYDLSSGKETASGEPLREDAHTANEQTANDARQHARAVL